ncbi:MAG: glycine cleavage system protein H [Nitrospiraceae bacterium]|nr:glycine cleavage system protein H [Nitrospiraceae bacterium]
MKIDNYELPDELLYNTDYSWIKIEDDIATLGVIEPAAKIVNYFVFAKTPEKGTKLKKGDTYISLEAIKWTGHLTTPLSGEIIEVNEDIIDDPSIINKDPYNKGWIMKIKISNRDEIKELKHTNEISEWIKSDVLKK